MVMTVAFQAIYPGSNPGECIMYHSLSKILVIVLLVSMLAGCKASLPEFSCSNFGGELKSECEQLYEQCGPLENAKSDPYCEMFYANHLLNVAGKTLDGRYCQLITYKGEHKDTCFSVVAANTADPKYCKEIEDEEMRSRCEWDTPAIITITENDIPPEYKPLNAVKEIELHPKTEMVQVVVDYESEYQYGMQDEYHLAALDPKECIKVKDAISVVPDKNNPFDGCINKIAELLGDYTICNEITEGYGSWDCVRLYAQTRGDLRACFLVDSDEYKTSTLFPGFSDCVKLTVNSKPTKSGCELLKKTKHNNLILADTCYLNLAGYSIGYQDPKIRETFRANSPELFEFYSNGDLDSNPRDFCNKINNIELKQRCISATS